MQFGVLRFQARLSCCVECGKGFEVNSHNSYSAFSDSLAFPARILGQTEQHC